MTEPATTSLEDVLFAYHKLLEDGDPLAGRVYQAFADAAAEVLESRPERRKALEKAKKVLGEVHLRPLQVEEDVFRLAALLDDRCWREFFILDEKRHYPSSGMLMVKDNDAAFLEYYEDAKDRSCLSNRFSWTTGDDSVFNDVKGKARPLCHIEISSNYIQLIVADVAKLFNLSYLTRFDLSVIPTEGGNAPKPFFTLHYPERKGNTLVFGLDPSQVIGFTAASMQHAILRIEVHANSYYQQETSVPQGAALLRFPDITDPGKELLLHMNIGHSSNFNKIKLSDDLLKELMKRFWWFPADQEKWLRTVLELMREEPA